MSTCCGPVGRGSLGEPLAAGLDLARVSLPPSKLCATQTLPRTAAPEGSLPPAHLVVSRHGATPLQEHALDAADGCPGSLSVPEQSRGARGCPVAEDQTREVGCHQGSHQRGASALVSALPPGPGLIPPHSGLPPADTRSLESLASRLCACILPAKLVHDGFAVLCVDPPGPGRG